MGVYVSRGPVVGRQSPLIPSAGVRNLQIINIEANQWPAAQGRRGHTADERMWKWVRLLRLIGLSEREGERKTRCVNMQGNFRTPSFADNLEMLGVQIHENRGKGKSNINSGSKTERDVTESEKFPSIMQVQLSARFCDDSPDSTGN